MSTGTEVASLLRGQLADIIVGTLFLVIGLIAFSVAAIRRRGGVRILVWLGLWSAMYGASVLIQSPAVVAAIPDSLRTARIWLITAISYLIIVAAALAFLELTKGKLRQMMWGLLFADLAVAVAGIGWFAVIGSDDAFIVFNHLLAVIGLGTLIVVATVPNLSQRFLVLSGHRVLTIGTFVFAAEALYVNIARPLNLEPPRIFDSLGFGVLLFSFGYVALKMIVTNERRLLSIENELEIARQLQFSILPESLPKITNLGISAAYEPMTAVAGDFYEFLPVDEHRVGFLVVDVSGHGVPAALIASMIKVATQSVDGCAEDPGEVLRRLGNILSRHLRGQFVSAAYLVDRHRNPQRRATLRPGIRHCSAGARMKRFSLALKVTAFCSASSLTATIQCVKSQSHRVTAFCSIPTALPNLRTRAGNHLAIASWSRLSAITSRWLRQNYRHVY